jgi:hypothetical protein
VLPNAAQKNQSDYLKAITGKHVTFLRTKIKYIPERVTESKYLYDGRYLKIMQLPLRSFLWSTEKKNMAEAQK